MEFKQVYNKTLGETVSTAEHESGLKVIVIKKSGFKKSYATFSTKYGSINTMFVAPGDSETTTVIDGVAHFLEHKVFEQPDGSNAFNEFSKYGASANAFTSFGVTNYLFSCTEHFYENLKILLSFVRQPYFTQENVEKEKGIIAQEIRMYEDDAEQTCFYNCLRGMYVNHPIKTNIAGSVDEIMKTTPELLYKCYNTFYNPDNMALICVGDIDENLVGKIVDELVPGENRGDKIKQIFPEEPAHVNEKRITAEFDIPMPMFMLGFKDIETGGDSAEMLKREILTNCALAVLFGKSSKFYKTLYDEGLINKTFSAFYEYEDSCAYAAFSAETNYIDEVEKRIYECLENAKKTGVDEKELERAKKVLIGKFTALLDRVEDLGNEYMFAYHRGMELLDYLAICSSITTSEVNKRIQDLFDKERSSISIVLPKSK